MPIVSLSPSTFTYTQLTVLGFDRDVWQQSSPAHSVRKPHRRGRNYLGLLQILMAFLALAVTAPALAQIDVVRPDPARPEPRRPEPRPKLPDGVDPHKIAKCFDPGGCAPVLHVQRSWRSTKMSLTLPGSAASLEFRDSDPDALANVRQRLGDSRTIVIDGDTLPNAWHEQLKDYRFVRKSWWSPNSDLEAAAAAELGDRPLDLENTKFYNSLPQQTGSESDREMELMGLDTSRREEWQRVNGEVVLTSIIGGLNMEVARKEDLMDDLQYGDKNIIFLIAHSDGNTVYLPGLWGESISLDEFSRIRRTDTPNRIIVAIVCEAGGVNGDQASLAELFLKNHLARTVFASPERVDARLIPRLLQKLREGVTLRKALDEIGFQQYVDLIPFGYRRWLPAAERPL